METRRAQLLDTQMFVQKVDQDLTMILQTLQWDRQHLLQEPVPVRCKFDSNHRIMPNSRVSHEQECYLKSQGYSDHDTLLPDPLDTNANTLVKLSTNDIKQIIDEASKSDPQFKKGAGRSGPEPLSLARLQVTYTADERRAIHDAVVKAVPSCHDLSDLALPCDSGERQRSVPKSRVDILAELRDMKRRRTKYRGAAKSRNYSDVLRDVVRTQMEMYTEALAQVHSNQSQERATNFRESDANSHKTVSRNRDEDRDVRSISRSRGVKERSDRREDSKTNEGRIERCDRRRDKNRDTSNDSRNKDFKYHDRRGDRRTDRDEQRHEKDKRVKYRDSSNSSRDKRDDTYSERKYKDDDKRRRDNSNSEAHSYTEKRKKHRHDQY